MQYANITISNLNRADFVSQRELSQQELNLAGGWSHYFKSSFAIATPATKAISLGGGFAITGSSTKATSLGGGFFKASFSPKAVSGTSSVKIAVK